MKTCEGLSDVASDPLIPAQTLKNLFGGMRASEDVQCDTEINVCFHAELHLI